MKQNLFNDPVSIQFQDPCLMTNLKNKINLKGKSVDKLGIIGNREASAAFVSISLTNA